MNRLVLLMIVMTTVAMAAGCRGSDDGVGKKHRSPRMNPALTSQDTLAEFRFERHLVQGDSTGSEVYVAKLTPHGTYLYFRPWNATTGWSYDDLDIGQLLCDLSEVVREAHCEQYKYLFLKYEKTDSNRWMVNAKTVAGRGISFVNYDQDEATRQRVIDVFARFTKLIDDGQLQAPHTRYDYDGKDLKREISYDAEGNVLNGYDYAEPDDEF